MQQKRQKVEPIIKIVEGAYRCYVNYKVSPSIKSTSQYSSIKTNLPISTELVDLHLSLSKTFYLSYSYAKPFVDRLKHSLNKFQATNVPLLLDKWTILNNFLVLTVRQPTKGKLTKTLKDVNTVMEAFGFQKYFDPPILHVSLFIVQPQKYQGVDLSKYAAPKTMTILKEICLTVGQKEMAIW